MTALSPSLIRLQLPLRECITVLNALHVPSIHIDIASGCVLPGFLNHDILQTGVLRELAAPLTFHIVPAPEDNITALNFLQAGDLAVLHVFPTTRPQTLDSFIVSARATGCRTGLAIDLEVATDRVNGWLGVLDTIFVMGIPLACYGLPLDTSAETRLAAVKEAIVDSNPTCHLALDGGVTASTFQHLIGRVDELVIGSLLFNASNLVEQWQLLSEHAQKDTRRWNSYVTINGTSKKIS